MSFSSEIGLELSYRSIVVSVVSKLIITVFVLDIVVCGLVVLCIEFVYSA